MTVKAANALYRYFEALYELNQNIIILCGVDVLDNRGQYEKQVETVIHLVPKLVPYVYDKKKHIYRIECRDGLLEFSDEIPFLQADYQYILRNHAEFLGHIKAIRNKLEHCMHGVRVIASGSGSGCLFEITYEVAKKTHQITANELIAFVKELNIVFSKIQKLIDRFAYEEQESSHPDYRRLVKYTFQDFNQIYESDLLRIFGKSLLPF